MKITSQRLLATQLSASGINRIPTPEAIPVLPTAKTSWVPCNARWPALTDTQKLKRSRPVNGLDAPLQAAPDIDAWTITAQWPFHPLNDDNDLAAGAVFFHHPVRLDDLIQGEYLADFRHQRARLDLSHDLLQRRAHEVVRAS